MRPVERPEAGRVVAFPKSVACIIATSGTRPEPAPPARRARPRQAAHRPSPNSTSSVGGPMAPSCDCPAFDPLPTVS